MIDINETHHFEARSELADTNIYNEDGQKMIIEVYSVIAQSPCGYQWIRYVGKDGVAQLEEGQTFVVPNTEAKEYAEELAAKLNRLDSPHLNVSVWYHTTAMYGSAAWSQDDEDSLMDSEELHHRYG